MNFVRCSTSRAAVRLGVATALAIWVATAPAWGHRFPPVHTAVVQVEACHVAVLIGYVPGSGEPVERIHARVASQPKSQALDALRDTLTAYAMAPFAVALDGVVLAPASVDAKIGLEAGGTRPSVVVLATFALPRDGAGGQLAITSRDPRTTRISWQDQDSGRIVAERMPAQGRWFTGVASFLLPLAPSTRGPACASARPRSSPSTLGSAPR